MYRYVLRVHHSAAVSGFENMSEHKWKIKCRGRSGIRLLLIAFTGVFAVAVALQFLFQTRLVFVRQTAASHSPTWRAASHGTAGRLTGESLSNPDPNRSFEGLAIPGKPVVAAWEWGKRGGKRTDYFNDEILYIKSPESQKYFDRLAECGINRLYLHVGVKGERLAYNESYLAGFLSRAKKEGIEVYALFGKPSFARIENHRKANAIVKAIIRYNEVHPDTTFAGIQSDIEPYYEFLASGTTRRTDLRVIGPQYVAEIGKQRELVDDYKKRTGRGLKLEAAIPFWYNIPAKKRSSGTKPVMLALDGFEGTITDHVIRFTDSVAVMAYRNNDEGEDGVSGVARYVVDAVSRHNKEYGSGKKVIIGLETKKPGSKGVVPKITVRKMSRDRLWAKILKPLGQRYREKPTVGGVSYHHTVSLFEMQKRWAEEMGRRTEMMGQFNGKTTRNPSDKTIKITRR